MTAATGMVVGNPLFSLWRTFVPIALIMRSRFGGWREAVGLLRGMGYATRPQHQDEHQRSDDFHRPLHQPVALAAQRTKGNGSQVGKRLAIGDPGL